MDPSKRRKLALRKLPIGTVIMLRRREDGRWLGQLNTPEAVSYFEGTHIRRILNRMAARQAALCEPPDIESPIESPQPKARRSLGARAGKS